MSSGERNGWQPRRSSSRQSAGARASAAAPRSAGRGTRPGETRFGAPRTMWNSSTTIARGGRAPRSKRTCAATASRARLSSAPQTSAVVSSPMIPAAPSTITTRPALAHSRGLIVERGCPTMWRDATVPPKRLFLLSTGLKIPNCSRRPSGSTYSPHQSAIAGSATSSRSTRRRKARLV
jgi:hypothetical protein